MGSLIRAANLNGLEELMHQLGGDAQALLRRYHIDPALIRDPEAYVPYKSMGSVLERAAIECQCPDFGLRLVQWQGLDMLGPVAVMARNAQTVLEAFGSLERYLHLHGPALKFRLRGRNAQGDYCFDYRIDEPGLGHIAQGYELSLANGIHILRMLAGASARPSRVYFMHSPLSSKAVYTQAFGCPVDFGSAHCGFDLRAEDMHQPVAQADAYTRQLVERFLEGSHSPQAQLRERVAALIHRLLATGHCTLGTVAEQLAMHPRTLQRGLSAEHTRFEALLDEIRRDKARQYLSHSAMRLSQVTGLLGYADQSTFNRACQRWYGCTPKTLRQSLQQPSVAGPS